MRVSVWLTVLVATLPASSNRSVCVATLTVLPVMGRALMTVMSVTTGKLSVTMESVWLGVPTALTMIRPAVNAEVGKVEVFLFCSFKTKEGNKKKQHLNIMPLFTVCLDVSQTVTSRVWPAQAMNPLPASPATLTGVKMPRGTACGLTHALCTRTRTRMGNVKSVTKTVVAVLGQAAISASAATSLISCSVSFYCNTIENIPHLSVANTKWSSF